MLCSRLKKAVNDNVAASLQVQSTRQTPSTIITSVLLEKMKDVCVAEQRCQHYSGIDPSGNLG